jgi:hypothetical protein
MRAARHTDRMMRKIRLKVGKFVRLQRGCRRYGHSGVCTKGTTIVDLGTPLVWAIVVHAGSEIALNDVGSWAYR